MGDFSTRMRSGWLLAVLLNPPATTTGIRTRSAVQRAGRVLGWREVRIGNLHAQSTPTVVELNNLKSSDGWIDARSGLQSQIRTASAVLGAWGVSGVTSGMRRMREAQVEWLYTEAARAGLTDIWMVGGEPRHPSRWHQYVSDRHGRTAGGSFDDRLRQVLTAVPLKAI